MKVRLGDVATYINGYAFKPEDWSDTGLPIIRIQDLTGNSYKTNRYNGEYDKKYEVNDGDILISWSASIGVYIWQGEKAVLNQHIFKVEFNKQVNICKNFYIYQVENILKKAISETHGATMKHLTKPIFDALPFYLPDIKTQNEISNVLDKITTIISLRKKQIKKFDELVKSRFIEMFGDVVINSKNWEQATLKNVAIGKLTYGSGASAINFNGKIRYIRITDISNDGELNDDIKSPSICDNKYLLNDGDILFARSGATVGKTFCFNKKRYGEAIYAGYLIRMIPDKKRVLPIYVFYYTKTDYYMSFISKAQKAVAQPNINAQEYGDLKICVPPIELQQRFVDFVKQTDKSKLEIQKSLDKLEILKKSLMQQYFG